MTMFDLHLSFLCSISNQFSNIVFCVPTPYRGWTLAVEMKSFKKFCYLLTIVETWKFLLQGSLFGDYEMLDIRY